VIGVELQKLVRSRRTWVTILLPVDPAGRPHPVAGREAGQRDGLRPARRSRRGRYGVRHGALLLGDGTVAGGTASISGSTLSSQELVLPTLLSLAYAMLSMLGVAAIALFLSTVVESPLAAALGTLAVLIGSTLLLTLDAANSFQPFLPTRCWLSCVDLFRDPILWRDVTRGAALQVIYVGVFLAAGWANFTTKDITT
jgi:ABC-2 type transport system permease protein